VDTVFKALADSTRRAILDRLHRANGQTLGELCAGLKMSRQGVSKHLAVLESAALVAVVWDGRSKLHYLNPVPLQRIYRRWIHKFERQRLEALEGLRLRLEREGSDDET